MVAIVRSSRSAKRRCQYNEAKVETGQAECIMAGNYPCEPEDLTATQRARLLEKRLDLNARSQKSALHIVLSFHPQDQLSRAALRKISQRYMDQTGLGDQPFLVYQHLDTLHPHLHIVTVTIKADGAVIDAFPKKLAVDNNVIKRIEEDFRLTAAQGRSIKEHKADSAQKLRYGKMQTVEAIGQVLSVVLPNFKYSSVLELNAILRHYNLIAKTGRPTSKISQNQGLAYQMLSEDGKTIGVPVKASSLPSKPTLAYLRQRFKANALTSTPQQQRIKTLIDLALLSLEVADLSDLQASLSSEGVKTVFAYDSNAALREIIFIDFRARSAFSAARLGERYTPSKILLLDEAAPIKMQAPQPTHQASISDALQADLAPGKPAGPLLASQSPESSADEGFLSLLLQPVKSDERLPYELRKQAKKKRRQISLQI
ncbi:relaxase/mobilization nuclease domain-containing protein [Dyadobacter sp. CY261]|uniref:relaxase/mobilization nuclease domain-containing protein n=1 Tax=Dyadobacter sp. CY261 TaxID=2907203 RepID=UPI001F2A07BB|nr:relaxase/mobilization nuclease domain-containing protein [Dyadobacter sp. CY261]MCF0075390.1 relaxase/mobilization nuclease domain-containing protein [Dyadobacter sp. CY261]